MNAALFTPQFLNVVAEFEGYRSTAYRCPTGRWTIGFGHTRGVRPGQRIDRLHAELLLVADLTHAADAARDLTGPERFARLPRGTQEALIDFVFNLGSEAYARSTLRRRVIEGAGDEALRGQLRRWVYAGGRRLPGLVRRREWEAARVGQD